MGALGWLAFQKRIDHLFCPPGLLEFLLSVSLLPFSPCERGGVGGTGEKLAPMKVGWWDAGTFFFFSLFFPAPDFAFAGFFIQ